MNEIFLGAIGLGVVFAILATPILAIVAYNRSRRVVELLDRVARLETALRGLSRGEVPQPLLRTAAREPAAPISLEHVTLPAAAGQPMPPPSTSQASAADAALDALVVDPARVGLAPRRSEAELLGLEFAIGRKALGWTAVVVLIFATGFFLRYAFANRWIGPVGQIAFGVLGGLALVVAGARSHRRGRNVFGQMLAAAGIVVLYLATYSAFAFYHLIDQQPAGLFLFAIVVESALVALALEAPAIAIMALVGGLLTPLLMRADHDQYASLFLYLTLLNAGVVGLLLLRAWPALGTLALAGTHALYWAWYAQNYHPEKFGWALGFVAVIYLMYLVQGLAQSALARSMRWEDLAVMPLNAVLWSAAAYVLLWDEQRAWLGTAAVVMAVVYAVDARLLQSLRADRRLTAMAVAISAGFVAVALPLEASAPWLSVGWAAEAAVLWWFGVRINSAPLRALAAVCAAAAVARLTLDATPYFYRDPFMPILNRFAATGLLATAILLAAIVSTRRRIARLAEPERLLVGLATVGCVLLVWWIVSADLYAYFKVQAIRRPDEYDWSRLGQMTLSAWWAVYATIVLLIGFRARRGLLRWTALGLYGLTVGKVFLFDMAGLDEIYRIVAFFVLAVLLGLAAWVYQRVQPGEELEGD
jgi:uncharacterized membrane protein